MSWSTPTATHCSATAFPAPWRIGTYVERHMLAAMWFAQGVTAQNVINRAAWKLAANNLVALNDTINAIAYLQKIANTGLAAEYDNAYVVCSFVCGGVG